MIPASSIFPICPFVQFLYSVALSLSAEPVSNSHIQTRLQLKQTRAKRVAGYQAWHQISLLQTHLMDPLLKHMETTSPLLSVPNPESPANCGDAYPSSLLLWCNTRQQCLNSDTGEGTAAHWLSAMTRQHQQAVHSTGSGEGTFAASLRYSLPQTTPVPLSD